MKSLNRKEIAAQSIHKLKCLATQSSAMPHPLYKGKILTNIDLDELRRDIAALSKQFDLQSSAIDSLPTTTPTLEVMKPVIADKVVRIGYTNQSIDYFFTALDQQFIYMDDETIVKLSPDCDLFKITHGDVSHTFSTPYDLKTHLNSGKNAVLVFKRMQGFLYWYSLEDAELLITWEVERDRFSEHSALVHQAFSDVSRVKRRAKALQQKYYLDAQLPFAWTVGIRPSRGGLSCNSTSSGNGDVATTVNHLIVKEDIHLGRLKRNMDDYLCTQSKGRLSIHLGIFIQELTIILTDGTVIENVPAEVTCESCLNKINTIINKKLKEM